MREDTAALLKRAIDAAWHASTGDIDEEENHEGHIHSNDCSIDTCPILEALYEGACETLDDRDEEEEGESDEDLHAKVEELYRAFTN